MRAQARVVLLGPDEVVTRAAEYRHTVLDHIEATQTASIPERDAAIDVSELRLARASLLGVMYRALEGRSG